MIPGTDQPPFSYPSTSADRHQRSLEDYLDLHNRVIAAAFKALGPREYNKLTQYCALCSKEQQVAADPRGSNARWSDKEKRFLMLVDAELGYGNSAEKPLEERKGIITRMMKEHGFPKRTGIAYVDELRKGRGRQRLAGSAASSAPSEPTAAEPLAVDPAVDDAMSPSESHTGSIAVPANLGNMAEVEAYLEQCKDPHPAAVEAYLAGCTNLGELG